MTSEPMSTQDALLATIQISERLAAIMDQMLEHVDAELTELRDGLIDLDHKKVPRSQFEELHNRVDALEARR